MIAPPLKVGSLFAGIGGFDLAARWMGWETAWFSEIDPYASAVLAKNFPGVPNHGDVTQIRGEQVAPVDLLCGGFPCQDISLAGKGAGIGGARSGLWSHYARLIGELRPRWVVAENVAALRGRGLNKVLSDLHALGYDAEWHCIPASAVGAPHRRDRIWIVAYPHPHHQRLEGWLSAGMQERARKWFAGTLGALVANAASESEPESGHETEAVGGERNTRLVAGGCRDRLVLAESRADVADAESSGRREEHALASGSGGGGGCEEGTERGRSLLGGANVSDAHHQGEPDGAEHDVARGCLSESPRGYGWWLAEPDVGRVAHGVPARVDRLRCLGNTVVPLIPYLLFQAIGAAELRMKRAA